MKKIALMILSLIMAFTFAACNSNDGGAVNTSYESVTAEEAKAIMDSEVNYVILDVRTEEEFVEGHISNAILIPDYEIADKVGEILTDKEQRILVYCRSGRRSKEASETLAEMGYTNVTEFGGIIDWPYEIVK